MLSAYFTGFLRVRKVRKILGVFEVFLGIFEKAKEKKDRVGTLVDTLGCLWGPKHPGVGHSLGHPRFSGTLLGTLWG